MIDLTKINESNNIYIIKSGNNVKLGFSSQILKRLASYNGANPDVELIKSGFVPDGLKFEQDFHRDRPAKYVREWYDISELYALIEALDANYKITTDDSKSINLTALLELIKDVSVDNTSQAGELYFEIRDLRFIIGQGYCMENGEKDYSKLKNRLYIYDSLKDTIIWGKVPLNLSVKLYRDKEYPRKYQLVSFSIDNQSVLLVCTAEYGMSVFSIYFNEDIEIIEDNFKTNTNYYLD